MADMVAPAGGSQSTAVDDVRRTILIVPTNGGVPDVGYVRLRPPFSGTYVLTLSMSDRCNVVQQTITVSVTVNRCCAPRNAINKVDTVVFGAPSMTKSVPLTPLYTTSPNNCLPPSYVGAYSTGSGLKQVYSPVTVNAQGVQYTMNTTGTAARV